jgi:hypothetical protein
MALTKANYRMIENAPANVKDFGATGDGVTNDYTAIQAAVNSGAKKVFIPTGTYIVNSPVKVPPDVSIYGDGKQATIITCDTGISGNFSQFNFAGSSPDAGEGLFTFLPGGNPSQIAGLNADLTIGDVDIVFSSAHGLSVGDLFIVNDETFKVLVKNISGSGFQVGETLTGGTTGATGVIKTIQLNGTYGTLYIEKTSSNFMQPIYGQSAATNETVTGSVSGTTATTTIIGGSFTAHRDSYALGDMFTVADVPNATTVRINGTVRNIFYASHCKVFKVNNPTAATIKDMSIIGSRDTSLYPFGISVHCGYGFNAENLEIQKFFNNQISLHLCYGSKVSDCEINQNYEYNLLGDYYGIIVANSKDINITQCSIGATRHSVTVGGYSYTTNAPNPTNRNIQVSNCFLTTNGSILNADLHGNTQECSYKDNVIYGGCNLGGTLNTIENNYILGIGDSQSSQLVWTSEMLSTEHYIKNNVMTTIGTAQNVSYGAIFIWTGAYEGVTEGGSPMVISGNRIVLEAGNGTSNLMAIKDTCGVGFNRGFELRIEQNEIYNTNANGIADWTSSTWIAPLNRLYLKDNIFRGSGRVLQMTSGNIKEVYIKGNYVDMSSSLDDSAISARATETLYCANNYIKNASAGGMYLQMANTQVNPIVVKDNVVVSYGYQFNSSSSFENSAIAVLRVSGGTSQDTVRFTGNRVLSPQSTAYACFSHSNVDFYINGNTKEGDFATPAGANWASFFTSSGGGALLYEGETYQEVTAQTALYVSEGSSAPATRASYASIYVDSADGDLKVKFGDGTVKTIATDT